MPTGITALTALYNRIMPDLPGCPTPLIEQTVIDIVRDFCTRTECWQPDVEQATVVDQAAYTLTPPSDSDIRRIADVWLDDMVPPLDPNLYEFDGVSVLTLDDSITPSSALADGLRTRLVLVPKINSTTWTTALMNRWADAIVLGVKAQLMDNDKEGWGNPRRGKDALANYLTQVALAIGETYRKYRRGSLSITARSWL